MTLIQRRVGLLGVVILALTILPAIPVADAAVAPWTWKRVVQNVTASATTSYTTRALCPAGYTAVTGGFNVPLLATVRPQAQYRADDGAGSGWQVIFRNFSNNSVNVSVVSECVETADLPPISYNSAALGQDGGYAAGSVSCPNAGEVVLTGGAEWVGTATNRELLSSAPNADQTSWYANGYNPLAADLYVEVYCVQAANVPGYERVAFTRTGAGGWYTDTVTCPVGKRLLNGGMLPTSYSSYPNLVTWTATTERFAEPSHVTRATCIDAGLPTVNLTFTSPGPSGSLSNTGSAGFSMTGTDPAGYPNNFLCAIDGGVYAACNGGADYIGLASGPHEFEVLNVAADGRTSNPAVYGWTVDTVAPTVTKPKLAKVTLTASTEATWNGSDEHTGIDHYQAAYRVFRTDGTASAWTLPPEWSDIGRSVQTPNIVKGQTVCISARSFDLVQNASPWSTPACTTRPFDDRALTASAGWSRASGSAFWLNTVTRTQGRGQTLTRADVHLNRVGILATQCPECGTVAVRVGDTTIGRIDLDRANRANRKVRLLPAFGDQTGAVTIRSVTTGQTISIDGLVAIQGGTIGPT